MRPIVLRCIIMCAVGMSTANGWWVPPTESVQQTSAPTLSWTSSPSNTTTKKRTQGRVIKRVTPYEDRKTVPYKELPYKTQQGLYLEKMPYYETIPHNSFIPHFATTYTGY